MAKKYLLTYLQLQVDKIQLHDIYDTYEHMV